MPNRWNFIQGDHANSSSKSKSKSAKVYRWTMQKRLQHHKKKLMDLEQAQKTFFSSQFDSQGSNTWSHLKAENQFRKELSQYAMKVGQENQFRKELSQYAMKVGQEKQVRKELSQYATKVGQEKQFRKELSQYAIKVGQELQDFIINVVQLRPINMKLEVIFLEK